MGLVESETVLLRYHQEDDATFLFDGYTGDPSSTRFLARTPHTDKEQTRSMLEALSHPNSLNQEDKCVWVVELKSARIPIGLITVVRDTIDIELHFGICRHYRGQGFGAAALGLAAQHSVSSGLGENVLSFTDIAHFAAQSTLEKAGFVRTGILENGYVAPQLNWQIRSTYRYRWAPEELGLYYLSDIQHGL